MMGTDETKTFDAQWRARFERAGRLHSEEHDVSLWSPTGLQRRRRLFAELLPALPVPERAKVLELGCGAGTYVRYLAGLGHSVIGVDYALPSLRRAIEADPRGSGVYVAADGYALPFEGGVFDLVVCIGILQAVGAPGPLMDEMARVMRPGGILVAEALNALELAASVRRFLDAVRGRPPRVRVYSPPEVEGWLEKRRLRLLGRLGVYLPPRALPALGRLFDRPAVTRALGRAPRASQRLAHAFWVVGQKP